MTDADTNSSLDNFSQYTHDTVLLEHDIPSPGPPQDLTFATLEPISPLARAAFQEVATYLANISSSHAKQFIVTSDSETTPGHYRLSLDLLPQTWNLGWVLGSGNSTLPDLGVDLLLTLQGSKYAVRGRHARLRPHLDSGALMLIADRGKVVYLNGKAIGGDQFMINRMESALSFGDLAYRLSFTSLSDGLFKDRLEFLKDKFGGYNTPLFKSLQATPSDRHFELQGFEIQAPFGSGTYGLVSPCRRLSDGNAYAVKCIKRNSRSAQDIKNEILVYRKIGKHDNLCSVIEILYSGGHENGMGSSPVDNIYIIHEPLCDSSFKSFIISSANDQERREAFIQASQGLAHLHDQGIMHRDIKPDNLMLATRNPLRVVIIDYGHATFVATSIDHYKGTIIYLAPEVQALKNGQSSKPYDRRCDTWALGLVGYQLFARLQNLRNKITLDTHGKVLQIVKSFGSGLSGPIAGLLSWNVARRLQAVELLRLLQQIPLAET